MTSLATPISDDTERPIVRDVRHGLRQPQKELPPKYFYDHRGSVLFEQITRLPEYYLTRTERRLLRREVPAWMAALRPATLVELGAGSGEKTQIILEAMRAVRPRCMYVPLDVSAEFLRESAARIARELPGLAVAPVIADMTEAVTVPADAPTPLLIAFLGSTIGNFDADGARDLLTRVRDVMGPRDRLLLGADLRKDVRTLERAYDDAAGVTAEFNRNVLRVVNRELGADFDLRRFAHEARYDADAGRVEMHLVARDAHCVRIPGVGIVRFEAGESIRTEICCKYDRPGLESLLHSAGLRIAAWARDDDAPYALLVAEPDE
jgi:L-histidine Nalpha-methyltransferase